MPPTGSPPAVHVSPAGPALPAPTWAAVFGLAALAGLFVAAAGGFAGPRAIYYCAVLGLIGVGGFVAATRREPARVAFLALVAALPFADVPVPPARFGVRVFDLVMLALAAALIASRFSGRRHHGPLLPSRSFAVAWLMFLVCAACSLYPASSAQAFLVSVGIYAFFLLTLEELGRERGFERLAALWAAVLILLSLGLFVDHFLHFNLSLRGGNLNQLTYARGLEIWRAGGFFQDPQKAGDFVAAMVAFLAVPAVRGRFAERRLSLLVWAAVLLGLAALFTTIARGAIIACLVVTALVLFAFNRWHPGVKLFAATAAAALALAAFLVPVSLWLDLLPDAVAARFAHVEEEFRIRLMIWFDTWDMFARHPLTGIGPGSFQPYLLDTRPGMTGYYGIGMGHGADYVPVQPESGYLTILYEGGLAGAAAALLLAADALRRAIAVLVRRSSDANARTETIAALAGLATFAVTFTTLFTVGDPRIAAQLMFFLAVLWRHTPPAPARGPS